MTCRYTNVTGTTLHPAFIGYHSIIAHMYPHVKRRACTPACLHVPASTSVFSQTCIGMQQRCGTVVSAAVLQFYRQAAHSGLWVTV